MIVRLMGAEDIASPRVNEVCGVLSIWIRTSLQVSGRAPCSSTKLLKLSRDLFADSSLEAIVGYALACSPIRHPERDYHPKISDTSQVIPHSSPIGPVATKEFSHIVRKVAFLNGSGSVGSFR